MIFIYVYKYIHMPNPSHVLSLAHTLSLFLTAAWVVILDRASRAAFNAPTSESARPLLQMKECYECRETERERERERE